VGQPFTQVKVYITDKGINLADVLALIKVLGTATGKHDYVATAEPELEVLK
jgi:hypothetical protein